MGQKAMGCSKSKATPPRGGPSSSAKAQAKKPQVERKKLDPADFTFSKRVDEVLIKEEGSIDGQQFNIEECRNCDIFLLDVIATSFIDECHDCRIFVGPVETSLFVRNCTNCSLILACQQFRSRDCENCKLAMYSSTEPIIETSQNMQFACFEFNYFSLRGQFSRAGLKPWNNKWWQVYDFNKNEDRPNWSIMDQAEVRQLLRLQVCASAIAPEELADEPVVPLTLGSRPWPSSETSFVLFLPNSDALVEAFISKAEQAQGWALCRTRATRLQEEQLKVLLAWSTPEVKKLPSQLKGQELTGVQVCGAGIWQKVQDAISLSGLASGTKSIRVIPEKDTATLAKLFFET